jgi:hypothetical protein
VRGINLTAPLDLSAAPVRELAVHVPRPPGPDFTVRVQFTPAALTAIGADPAAVSAPQLRRLINRSLRLGPVGVRCVLDGVQLVVADGGTLDLVASKTAFPDATAAAAAIASGAWITLGELARGTANDVRVRVRNAGGAPEPTATWRAYWFDPAATPIVLDSAHQIATATLPLAAGAEAVIHFDHDPGAASEATRGVLVWLSSDGDPVRAPLAEPPAGPVNFGDVGKLAAYCAAHRNVGYRVLDLVPP